MTYEEMWKKLKSIVVDYSEDGILYTYDERDAFDQVFQLMYDMEIEMKQKGDKK